MIGRLTGVLVEKTPPLICLDVNGIGFEVSMPMNDVLELPDLGEQVTVLTHFVVREDAQQLYGFLTAADRETFRTLIKISGIGPRTGLAILSGMNAEELAMAVEHNHVKQLCTIPGIGQKTAERLVLELRGKLLNVNADASPVAAAHDERQDIANALMALGYSEKETQRVLRALAPDVSVSEGIRQGLKLLSQR